MNFTTEIINPFNESIVKYSESAQCVNWCKSVHFANDYSGIWLLIWVAGSLGAYLILKDVDIAQEYEPLSWIVVRLPEFALIMLIGFFINFLWFS